MTKIERTIGEKTSLKIQVEALYIIQIGEHMEI